MKKAVLASAIFAALVSGSTLAATVYDADGTQLKVGGRVEFRGDFNAKTDGTEIEGTMVDNTRARLNIEGRSEISEGLSGFARYENEQKDGSAGSTFTQRYMFAGLDFDGHALSFGSQDTAAVQVSKFSDIGEFTGNQKKLTASGDHKENVIAYRGQITDELNLQATYQVLSSDRDNADGYGISAVYKLPMGLKLGAAYTGEQEDAEGTTGNQKANQFLLGLGYSIDALYLGATYSTGDTATEDQDFDVIEIAASYKINDQTKVQAIYGKDTDKPDGASDIDNEDFVELGGYYSFNSNLSTYLALKLNQVDNADDTYRVGLKYAF
ncbi:porin [Vibrio tritonius]|uniref:Porin n=1 Tax=Vibrio tritonius TaxID=1435069 RepID=A0ABS7YSM3_9VIBR|nr:porin [Vibrio tritonius]MCA2018690.1 porin [Vibrio tritonius]